MDDGGVKECWTRVFEISFSPLKKSLRYDHTVFGDYRAVNYISILENGAVLISLDYKKVVLYSPEDEIFTIVFDSETLKLGKPGTRAGDIMSIMCLGTLVSPESSYSSSPSV